MNALRVAMRIFSGKIILNFGFQESLRTFLKTIFTGGAERETAFAAPLSAKARRCGRIPLQSLLRKASSPKGAPFGDAGNFDATTEAVPLGKVAKPQALTEGVASEAASFALEPETVPPCQGLSLWERWHGVCRDGEGEPVWDFPPHRKRLPAPQRRRQPFPEENKENTRPKGQSEYQNMLSSL